MVDLSPLERLNQAAHNTFACRTCSLGPDGDAFGQLRPTRRRHMLRPSSAYEAVGGCRPNRNVPIAEPGDLLIPPLGHQS